MLISDRCDEEEEEKLSVEIFESVMNHSFKIFLKSEAKSAFRLFLISDGREVTLHFR